MSENSRRDFLRKLGLGAAVVASPVALGACLPVSESQIGHTLGQHQPGTLGYTLHQKGLSHRFIVEDD